MIKSEIRSKLKLIRNNLHKTCDKQICAKNLINNLAPLLNENINVVAGYYPKADEFDLIPVLEYLRNRNIKVCLPYIPPNSLVMQFKQWNLEDQLIPGAFGILEPCESSQTLIPDLVLAPLLAVDKKGNRIGYGRGHYDATIRAMRKNYQVLLFGVCYDGQIIKNAPSEPDDEALDYIVTEKELYICQK